jgi:hypothetical protein
MGAVNASGLMVSV